MTPRWARFVTVVMRRDVARRRGVVDVVPDPQVYTGESYARIGRALFSAARADSSFFAPNIPQAASMSRPRVVRTKHETCARSRMVRNRSTRSSLGLWNADSGCGLYGMRFTFVFMPA